jgi:ABC-type polysaccharide/polyol phosphate transport system ATPase subunit
VLRVENVGKKFAYSLRDVVRYGAKRLVREFLGLPAKTGVLEPGEFWALDDVSFEVRRGETLGIIGRNGAGKSTLLKLINGVYLPDKGSIAFKGAVGGLIEIGAGFQPNLTGRENIYIVASLVGMTKDQVEDVLDDIIAFANIGPFIDSPVQSYSSGMSVRLAFAIHVFHQPDVLLADEVLAVGDFDFQQKCMEKINEIRSELGMILVSHSMPMIVRFCDRVIVLEKGRIGFCGPADEGATYLTARDSFSSCSDIDSRRENKSVTKIVTTDLPPDEVTKCETHLMLPSGKILSRDLFGSEYWNLEKIRDISWEWSFDNSRSRLVGEVFASAQMTFSFQVTCMGAELIVGVPFFATDGTLVTAFNTDAAGFPVAADSEGRVRGTLLIPRLSLNPGDYVACLAIVNKGTEYIYRKILEPISIVHGPFNKKGCPLYFGYFSDSHSWRFENGLPSPDAQLDCQNGRQAGDRPIDAALRWKDTPNG